MKPCNSPRCRRRRAIAYNASEELWLFLPPCFYSGYATPAALCGAGARGDVKFEERNAESERRAHGRALGHDAQDRAAVTLCDTRDDDQPHF